MLSHPQGTPSKPGTVMVQACAPAIQSAYPEPHPKISDICFSALSQSSMSCIWGQWGWPGGAGGWERALADHLPEGTHGQSPRQPP